MKKITLETRKNTYLNSTVKMYKSSMNRALKSIREDRKYLFKIMSEIIWETSINFKLETALVRGYAKFEPKYRMTERYWGILDIMYRYELSRIRGEEINIEEYVERVRRVIIEEVWDKDIEKIIREFFSGKEGFEKDYILQEISAYFALSIFLNKKIIEFKDGDITKIKKFGINKKEVIENEHPFKMDWVYVSWNIIEGNIDLVKNYINNKPWHKVNFDELGKYYVNYMMGIINKEECKKLKSFYTKFFTYRRELEKKNGFGIEDVFDAWNAELYYLGVKMGYEDCLKDVADNDKIYYPKKYIENPIII